MSGSAKASGADASANGSARGRQTGGSGGAGAGAADSGRSFTPEQQAAVTRIRKCTATAYYDILGLEAVRANVADAEIKRAYRKQSLLTHPDKNGHPHADEAFKMVSNAFGVLGDREKREKFDRFGVDPDSRFASHQAQNNPFATRAGGFQAGRGGGGGGAGWEDEISPEEMFQRFFAGTGFGGGFGGLDNSGPFVFNMGGGPGFRVHTFGGGRPRARPRPGGAAGAGADQQQQQPTGQQTGLSTLISLLPIFLFFILPFITSLFSGAGSTVPTPRMVFDNPAPPYVQGRTTEQLGVRYFVDPRDVSEYTAAALTRLDRTAEHALVSHLKRGCQGERATQQSMREDAQGFWSIDRKLLEKANLLPTPNCDRLKTLGVIMI